MANPADAGVAFVAVLLTIAYIALFLGAIAAVVMAVRALRTMAVELQLMNSTIASGVDDLSEELQEIRDALQTGGGQGPATRVGSGHHD